MGIPAILTQEPGGTPLGHEIRRWLKGKGEIDSPTELLLFNASRAQLVSQVIRPALEGGTVVICDRFAGSTVAYQGYGRGVDLSLIEAANKIATQGLYPNIIVLLDIDAEQGLARKRLKDRFEREDLAFHQRVREGYLKMAAAEPERWLVVDASLPQKEVQEQIWQRAKQLLG